MILAEGRRTRGRRPDNDSQDLKLIIEDGFVSILPGETGTAPISNGLEARWSIGVGYDRRQTTGVVAG